MGEQDNQDVPVGVREPVDTGIHSGDNQDGETSESKPVGDVGIPERHQGLPARVENGFSPTNPPRLLKHSSHRKGIPRGVKTKPQVEESHPIGGDVSAPIIQMTAEDFQKAMTAAMQTVADRIAKGDPDIAAEKEEQRLRKLRARDAMIAATKASEEETRRIQASCNHRRNRDESEKYCTGGQLFNDNKVHIFCLYCRKEWVFEPDENVRRAIESGDASLSGITPPREQPVGV